MCYQDEDYKIVKCSRCGLGYLSPMPTDEDIAAFYADTTYFEDMYHRAGIVSSQEAELRWPGAPPVPVGAIRRFSRGGRLLEVLPLLLCLAFGEGRGFALKRALKDALDGDGQPVGPSLVGHRRGEA